MKLVRLVQQYAATDPSDAPREWEAGYQVEMILSTDAPEFQAMGQVRLTIEGSYEGLPRMTPEEMAAFLAATLKRML